METVCFKMLDRAAGPHGAMRGVPRFALLPEAYERQKTLPSSGADGRPCLQAGHAEHTAIRCGPQRDPDRSPAATCAPISLPFVPIEHAN
jgi:hypothetical protein